MRYEIIQTTYKSDVYYKIFDNKYETFVSDPDDDGYRLQFQTYAEALIWLERNQEDLIKL